MSVERSTTYDTATVAAHPTISIAMCTHNGERFLEEQLLSFVRQSRLPDQVVIFDDLSTDGTRAILNRFVQTAPFPIELRFNSVNLGVQKNFEQALLACTGDYVALCDQDDRWADNKLERLSDLLDANPQAGYACSNAALIDKYGWSFRQTLWDNLKTDPESLSKKNRDQRRAYTIRSNCVTGATMMVRRDVMRQFLSPIPMSWVHDHWLAILCEVLNRPGCSTPELLTQYRLHAGQTIGIGKRAWFRLPQTPADRLRKLQQRVQRNIDFLSHLHSQVIPRYPDAVSWIDVIDHAQKDLDRRRIEAMYPWWHRGWNRFVRRYKRAG